MKIFGKHVQEWNPTCTIIIIILLFLQNYLIQSSDGSILPASLVTSTVSTDISIGNISRHNDGDIFVATRSEINVVNKNCGADICVEKTSGTATDKSGQSCTCQCLNHLPAFRDDLHICVDDIHECSLAPFVSGSTSQRIPFVFLPLKGQIVHPSKEISFTGIHTPLCAVSGSQFLTSGGWIDLRNPTDGDVPFRLFHDEGRTFLQWLGETELRTRMTGRLILVHMVCRDIGIQNINIESDLQQAVFTPCVAFRVVGSPVKYQNNVSEVLFSPDTQSSLYNIPSGLNSSEYIAIGICSVLLGLIYVASVFLYLYLRRRKESKQTKSSSNIHISSVGGTGIIQSHHPHSVLSTEDASTITEQPNVSGEDVIVKNNPLIKISASRLLQSASSIGKHNSASGEGADTNADEELRSAVESGASDADGLPDVLKNHGNDVLSTSSSGGDAGYYRRSNNYTQVTSALVHQNRHERKYSNFLNYSSESLQDSTNIERLPEENVSIIETTEGREDRPEAVKPIVNNNTRRKLYFNPAYFEPHLLAAPPPAAIEFLQKIREVITIAKQKMATKRFIPSLMGIPEEDFSKSSLKDSIYELYPTSLRNSNVSLKRENIRRPTQQPNFCSNCDITNYFKSNDTTVANKLSDVQSLPKCKSCTLTAYENKKRSIRKWLEDVPVLKSPVSSVRSEDPRILNSYISEKLKSSFDKIVIPERSPSFYSDSKHHIKSKLPRRLSPPSATDRYKEIPPPVTPQNLSSHPDMINEAIAVDSNKIQNCKKPMQNESKEKMAAVINEFAVLVKPHVNGENVREHRNSSDYETDSLERLNKRKVPTNGFHTPTDYGDIPSSQPSPSLSNVLPLDEEMTMRNAILSKSHIHSPKVSMQNEYNNHEYEVVDRKNNLTNLPELLIRDDCYSFVSEVYVNNGYNYDSSPSSPSDSECSSVASSTHNRPPKIRYTEPEKPGHLLIEVEDCANNYIRVEDSDQFEPDTFDRKSSRRKSKKANDTTKTECRQDSLERPCQILLRSSGSFKSANQTNISKHEPLNNYFNRNFGSLREIYEAKARIRSSVSDGPNSLNSDSISWRCNAFEEGRILTLEARHSRRQRKSTPTNTCNKLAPPDVIPPLQPPSSPIYKHPKPPKNIFDDYESTESELPPKNGVGRGTMKLMDTNNESASPFISSSVSLPSTISGTSVNSSKNSSNFYRHKGEDFLKSGIEFCNHSDTKLTENCSTNKITQNINHNSQFILKSTNNLENIKLFQRKLETDVLLNDMIKDSGTELTKHICEKDNYNIKHTWRKMASLKSPKPEDSGYLSTDSNEEKYQMKEINEHLESVSETEDGESLGDGHSESGAESVETHSVFFGSFRQKRLLVPIGNTNSDVSCDWVKTSPIMLTTASDMCDTNFTNDFDHFKSNTNRNMNFITVLPLTNGKSKQ